MIESAFMPPRHGSTRGQTRIALFAGFGGLLVRLGILGS